MSDFFTNPEIIAVIIGVILTGIVSAIVFYIRTRRANHVIVAMMNQSPQFKISNALETGLEIHYRGQDVKQLVLSNIDIWNNGYRPITDVIIKIIAKPAKNNEQQNINILDILLEDYDELCDYNYEVASDNNATISISRPYLNHNRAYSNELLKISLLTSEIVDISVSGSGEGWSSKLIDKRYSTSRENLYYAFVIFLLCISSLIYAYFASVDSFMLIVLLFIMFVGIGSLAVIAIGLLERIKK